ncbi:PqqD family peptide modification chaperone [Aerosakkonema sp. BLCC-F2]
MSKVCASSVIVAGKEQISSDLAGEAVILNLKNGGYYSLNSVGLRIWELIAQPKTITEIRATIVAEYDVEPEECNSHIFRIARKTGSRRTNRG